MVRFHGSIKVNEQNREKKKEKLAVKVHKEHNDHKSTMEVLIPFIDFFNEDTLGKN